MACSVVLEAYFIKPIERNIVAFTLILFVSTYVLNIGLFVSFFCIKIRTLVVQTYDFSWIYELSIYVKERLKSSLRKFYGRYGDPECYTTYSDTLH